MKKYIFTLFIAVATLTSCSKNDPTPEVDQEELSTATLTFTAVQKIEGSSEYTIIEGEDIQEIKFTGAQLAPEVGAHLHLEVGTTYKMELKTTDFLGRSSQGTFIDRADSHQAFLLGAPANSLAFEYGDNQVGVTAYLTVLEETNSFQLRYIMRHLNPGVKAKITAADWNNTNYTQFTGANDLDLLFEAHFTEHGHDH